MQGRVLPAVGACEQRAGIMEVQGTLEHSQQPWVVANRKGQGEAWVGSLGPCALPTLYLLFPRTCGST